MTEIFDDLHEEILRERLFQKLRRWFPYIVTLAIAILLGTGAYLFYESWREKRLYEEEMQYREGLALLEKGDLEGAKHFLEPLAQHPKGYGFLAAFQLCRITREQYQTTLSLHSLKELEQKYNALLESQYPRNEPMRRYMFAVLDLLALERKQPVASIQTVVDTFSFPQASSQRWWHEVGDMSRVLWKLTQNAPLEDVTLAFRKWFEGDEGRVPEMRKIAQIGAMGARVSLKPLSVVESGGVRAEHEAEAASDSGADTSEE